MPLEPFFPFEWENLLDILVISFIVHRTLILLRGTTAFQVVVGLVFLWLFQALAQSAGLVLTSWFFQGLGAVAVLVIVVVFRSEIRELLIQTNPLRFFLGRSLRKPTAGLEPVIQGIFHLAQERIGALIVLRNRDALAGHLMEGFALDGRFNAQIIESIFVKESPVHDGAMVIQGDRISRVGAFLPLTERRGLPEYLGTRHRAAIGLSERTDALVLVASEERGQVSLVHKGNMQVMLDKEQLRDEIGRLLFQEEREERRQKRGRGLLYQAAGLLVTFLLISTLWGIYAGRQLSLIRVTTNIDFRNIPGSLDLQGTSTQNVEVQVRGRRPLISALGPKDIRAFLDLTGVKEGAHNLVLKGGNVELPPGLEVVGLVPSTVKVELERRIEKTVPVNPKFTGVPPQGYRIEKARVSPEQARISGPASAVNAIQVLYTEPIQLDGLEPKEAEKTLEAPLAVSPASVRLLPGQPQKAQVIVQVRSVTRSEEEPRRPQAKYHEVLSGETLWGVARRYGLTVEALRKMNDLSPQSVLRPGQRLVIVQGPGE